MGQCLKICEGTFCLELVDSTAISGQILLILVLDQFSQHREMRLELANLRKIIAKLYELFFRSFSSLNYDQLQILPTVHLKTAVASKKKFFGFAGSRRIFLR